MYIKLLCNENEKIFNKILVFKKNLFTPLKKISCREACNTCILHSRVLERCLYKDNLIKNIVKYNYVVSSDITVDEILKKFSNSIDVVTVDLLVKQYPILKNMKKGYYLSWIINKKEGLQYLIWDNISCQETRIYHRVRMGFTESIIRVVNKINDGKIYTVLYIGKCKEHLIYNICNQDVKQRDIVDIINMLRYQVDYKQVSIDDTLSILLVVDRYGMINKFLGARLCTAGKNYYIFRASNGKLYDQKAIRLEENFIRFPVPKPFRISSNFNLHRLNPITRQISPHAGVDFAVPVGTPVFSIGDGEVIVSAYSKIAGNYIVIQHNYHCITRYMHLKKLLVKFGDKVKKGENIALSGNTGRSTGPHLHFEIWVNNRPVDPLKITKISNFDRLLGNERILYLNYVNDIIPQLTFY